MHSMYLINLMKSHLCKILSIFWTRYVMIEEMIFVIWKSVDCSFFFLLKDPFSPKLISRKFRSFVTRESLSREIFWIPSFANVYPKKFAIFFCSQKFLSRKFLWIKYVLSCPMTERYFDPLLIDYIIANVILIIAALVFGAIVFDSPSFCARILLY